MASLRGERSIAKVYREHQISSRKRVADLARALGKKTSELEVLGTTFRVWK